MHTRLYVKVENDRYYISTINHKKLKRICALHHVSLNYDTTKKQHYIGVETLGTFIRVMREHNIDTIFS